MIKSCISVTSHALDPLPLSQTVTPSRTPSPLERDVLYGRPHRPTLRTQKRKNNAEKDKIANLDIDRVEREKLLSLVNSRRRNNYKLNLIKRVEGETINKLS